MAISKATRWITFGSTPSTAPTVQQAALSPVTAPVYGSNEKQFGFTNFGNTCYANSVLQALYFCSPFRDLVLQSIDASASSTSSAPAIEPASLAAPPMLRRQSAKRMPSEATPSASAQDDQAAIPAHPPTLFSALRSLFMYISKHPAEKGTVAPRAFVDKLKSVNELFQGTQHQDAHEFLNYLLNKIVEEIQTDRNHRDGPLDGSHDDLSGSVGTLSSGPAQTSSSSSSYEPTLVQRLFEGVLTSETRCLTCETVTSRDESFLDLSIDIEQNSSVTACLRQFSASEMLCQRNKFFCDSCAGLQEAEKRMKIKKLPNILALHLKRFKYQEDIQKYIKLTYRVAFPLELRLFNTVDDAPDPDRLYELFAIVIHIGAGPHHGHYITIIKGPHSWLVYDDDKIEPIKESEISKYFGDAPGGAAYVLFYEAVNLEPSELGIRPVPPRAAPTDVPAPLPVVKLHETANGSIIPVSTPPGLKPGSSQEELLVLQDGRSEASTSTSAPASPVIVPQKQRSPPSLSVVTSGDHLPPPAGSSQGNGYATSSLKSPKSGGSMKRKLKGADAAPSSPHEATSHRPRTAPGSVSPTKVPLSDAPPVPPLPSFKVDNVADSPKSPVRKSSKWGFRRSLRAIAKGEDKDARDKKDDERETVGTSSMGSVAHSMASAPSQASVAESAASGSSVFRRASLRMTQGHQGHARRVSAGTFEPPPPLASASTSTQPASQAEEQHAHAPVTGDGHALDPIPATPSVVEGPPRINGHISNGSPAPPQLQRLATADVFNATPSSPASKAEPPTPTRSTRRTPEPPTPTRSALKGAPPSSTASPPLSPPPRSPARPKTASGTERAGKHSSIAAPMPMPPSSPSASKAAALSDSEAAHTAKNEHRHSHHTRDLIDKLRPHSAHGHAAGHGHGYGTGHRPSTSIGVPSVPSIPPNATSPQLSASSPPSAVPHEQEKEKAKAGFKRAARKLSLTGAMFGLGKDKDKERRTRPPSAYLGPATPR